MNYSLDEALNIKCQLKKQRVKANINNDKALIRTLTNDYHRISQYIRTLEHQ